jgi:hypothetical protein
MAVGATLPFFFGAGTKSLSYFFEVTIASDGRGFAQVFYDEGQGFREQDSVRQNFNGTTRPAVYRFRLPAGVCGGLRLDPISHGGTADFSDAKIVDSEGRVVRRFSPGDFPPTHDLASLEEKGGGLEMRTPPGGDDPYLIISTGGPLVIGPAVWDRFLRALPAFLAVFAVALCAGSLLPESVAQNLQVGSGRWMLAGGFCLVAAKLWLVAGQTVTAVGPASYDDRLFLEQASSLLAGKWLGPYSHFTMMKGPMYSFFVSVVFLLGVPLFTAQHLFYALSCWLVVRALRPLAPQRWVAAALFAVLLFNPITFDGPRMMRVARQDIMPGEVLMLVAGFIGLYARRAGPKRNLVPWAALAGLVLPAFWLTREEGVWLLPCLAPLWIAAAAAVWIEHKPDRLARLAILALPALGWAAGMGAVSAVNDRYYGLFTTCEFRRPEFKDAYGALMRVEPAVWRPGIVVPREARERIYPLSPAFAELRPFLEGPEGMGWAAASQGYTRLPPSEHEFAAGWFVWALREAVTDSGHGRTGPDAMAFYARIAREVNGACDAGLLKAGPGRSGFQPPLRREYLRPAWAAALESARLVFFFQGLTAYPPASVGTPKSLVLFADLTRGRLSPVPGGEHIWPKQHWLDRVRVGILEEIWLGYSFAAPWLVRAAVTALLAAVVIAILRRRIHFLAILALGILASVCAMIAICALLDATSFHAADPMYLSGAYGLVLLLVFVGWLALAESLRRGPD